MLKLLKHIILLTLLSFSADIAGQNLMYLIERSEKAVFEIRAYNKHGIATDTASGFFISADGMAYTKASIFYNKDSITVITRNNKHYLIEKIISVNPYADLALIKIKQTRQRGFVFFHPIRDSLVPAKDMVIMSHPDGKDKGISVDQIFKTGSFPFVNRYGLIFSFLGPESYGAPVINSSGFLTGIYCTYNKKTKNIVYSVELLNDDNWIDINTSKIKHNRDAVILPQLSMGITNLISGNPAEAARSFSKYLRSHSNSYIVYCLRALARYGYKNPAGARDDLTHANTLNPHGFLAPYVKALHFLSLDQNKEALKYLSLTLDRNPDYVPAKVEHARLEWQLNNNIKEAFDEFNDIIDTDTLEGKAYYERARLSMQYSSNSRMAYEDINRAIRLDPTLPGAFTLRGVMKLSNNDYLSAIDDFTKAIDYDPNDVHAFFNRGIAYFNIGMKRSACKDWQKSGELGNFSAYRYISRYCSKE
jgi:tetratricopeptide (TPR) repeat protein